MWLWWANLTKLIIIPTPSTSFLCLSWLWRGNYLGYGMLGNPDGLPGKESSWNAGDTGLIPGSGRFPWRRQWQTSPVFLPGKFHGQRSLAGYSPRGHRVGHKWATKHHNGILVGSNINVLILVLSLKLKWNRKNSWLFLVTFKFPFSLRSENRCHVATWMGGEFGGK